MLTPEKIRTLRRALRLTPTEFGMKVGKSAASVSRWEAGLSHPTYLTMQGMVELAEEAGIDLDKALAKAR